MKKVILVTGANSALGKLIVKAFLGQPATIYASARDPHEIEENANVVPVKLDITNDNEVKSIISKIIKEEGRVDVLINNAGYTVSGEEISFEVGEFLRILDTNTVGAFRLIKEVVPYMKRQRSGRIINLTSLNGLVSFPGFSLYSASKHALEALGDSLYYELAKYKIGVTNVVPGAISMDREAKGNMAHKPAREKFKILYFLLPMATGEKVAEVIKNVALSTNPPSRIILGSDAKIIFFLWRFLPNFVWRRMMRFVWEAK